jgi:hypothetical protein
LNAPERGSSQSPARGQEFKSPYLRPQVRLHGFHLGRTGRRCFWIVFSQLQLKHHRRFHCRVTSGVTPLGPWKPNTNVWLLRAAEADASVQLTERWDTVGVHLAGHGLQWSLGSSARFRLVGMGFAAICPISFYALHPTCPKCDPAPQLLDTTKLSHRLTNYWGPGLSRQFLAERKFFI